MNDRRQDPDQTDILRAWADAVLAELDLPVDQVDIDGVLGLAGVVAHAVLRPAAPLTAYLVGRAVGLAVQGGDRTESEAFAQIAARVRALADSGDFAPAASE